MENFDLNGIGQGLLHILSLAIYAIIGLIIGFWIIKRIVKLLDKVFDKTDYDPSLEKFISKVTSISLKVLLVVLVATLVGIPTTSFVAIIGAAGLAVGLALQGSLSNFAGGVLILILKPFKVGDFIVGANHSGTVTDISIFYTYMDSVKNQAIIIPNSLLSNDSIVNYSKNPTRRLDLIFGIDYNDDIEKAKDIVRNILDSEKRVLKEPEYLIAIDTLEVTKVNLLVRLWTSIDDYWDMNFYLLEKIKKSFEENGLSIPTPKTEIRINRK